LQSVPVIDGALVIIIIAWQVSFKLAHAHSPEKAIICDNDLTLVINGTAVIVVACCSKGWDAKAETKASEFRVHCHTEAWTLVALSKVKITIFPTRSADLAWRRNAAALIAVATAQGERIRQLGSYAT
jgi:hypothetical protein